MKIKVKTSITILSDSTGDITAAVHEGQIHLKQGEDLIIIDRSDAQDIFQTLMYWALDNEADDPQGDAP